MIKLKIEYSTTSAAGKSILLAQTLLRFPENWQITKNFDIYIKFWIDYLIAKQKFLFYWKKVDGLLWSWLNKIGCFIAVKKIFQAYGE